MKFKLIKYNYNRQIRIILLFLIYAALIFIGIYLKSHIAEPAFFKWILIFLLGIEVVHRFFIKTYDVLGSCDLKPEEILIIINGEKIVFEHSIIEKTDFYYGGYNGKLREWEIFYTGSRSRDGSKNFIVINGNRYQILLEDESGKTFIKSYLSDLKKLNINANFIKHF